MDLGPAAYAAPPSPVRSPAEEPGAKKQRIGDEQPRGSGVAAAADSAAGSPVVVVVEEAASLSGLEERIFRMGEVPRFVADAGHLRHTCTSAEAEVLFWPGSLQWRTDGRDAAAVEQSLLAPTGRVTTVTQPQPQPQPSQLLIACSGSVSECSLSAAGGPPPPQPVVPQPPAVSMSN